MKAIQKWIWAISPKYVKKISRVKRAAVSQCSWRLLNASTSGHPRHNPRWANTVNSSWGQLCFYIFQKALFLENNCCDQGPRNKNWCWRVGSVIMTRSRRDAWWEIPCPLSLCLKADWFPRCEGCFSTVSCKEIYHRLLAERCLINDVTWISDSPVIDEKQVLFPLGLSLWYFKVCIFENHNKYSR